MLYNLVETIGRDAAPLRSTRRPARNRHNLAVRRQPRDRVLFHIFRHIEPQYGAFLKQELCQRFSQLGFQPRWGLKRGAGGRLGSETCAPGAPPWQQPPPPRFAPQPAPKVHLYVRKPFLFAPDHALDRNPVPAGDYSYDLCFTHLVAGQLSASALCKASSWRSIVGISP